MAEKSNIYVVEVWHEPGTSPLGNASYKPVRDWTHEAFPRMVAERGMTLRGMYHLDPQHRSYLIVEAKSVEAVCDVLTESKFMQWCDGRVYPALELGDDHWFTDGPAAGVN